MSQSDILDYSSQNIDIIPIPTNIIKTNNNNNNGSHIKILICINNSIVNFNNLMYYNNIMKLDLSYNCISVLPNYILLSKFKNLRILLLNNNNIDSIIYLKDLSYLTNLNILTMHNNPINNHPSYRHYLVNLIPNLKLLDNFIISDEELIEGALFGNKFGKGSPNFYFNLKPFDPKARQLRIMQEELKLVKSIHRKLSPVLTIQRYFRGFLVRRAMIVFQISATIIQRAFRIYSRRKRFKMAKAIKHERNRMIILDVNSIYLLNTNELEVSIFFQLLKNIESKFMKSGIAMKLSSFYMVSDINEQIDSLRESLNILPIIKHFTYPRLKKYGLPKVSIHRRANYLNNDLRNIFKTSQAVNQRDKFKRFYIIRCPSSNFYEELLASIKDYNHRAEIDMEPMLLVYSGPLVRSIAASVTIQSAWRGFYTRRLMKPIIIEKLLFIRSIIAVQRLWKRYLLNQRFQFFTLLKQTLSSYEDSKVPKLKFDWINVENSDTSTASSFPTVFYIDPALFTLISSPNDFVATRLLPEHYLRFKNCPCLNSWNLVFDKSSFPLRQYPFPSWLYLNPSNLKQESFLDDIECSYTSSINSLIFMNEDSNMIKVHLLSGRDINELLSKTKDVIPTAPSSIPPPSRSKKRNTVAVDQVKLSEVKGSDSISDVMFSWYSQNYQKFKSVFPDRNQYPFIKSPLNIVKIPQSSSNTIDTAAPYFLQVTFSCPLEAKMRLSLLYLFWFDPCYRRNFEFTDLCMNFNQFKDYVKNNYRPLKVQSFEHTHRHNQSTTTPNSAKVNEHIQPPNGHMSLTKTIPSPENNIFGTRFFNSQTKDYINSCNIALSGSSLPVFNKSENLVESVNEQKKADHFQDKIKLELLKQRILEKTNQKYQSARAYQEEKNKIKEVLNLERSHQLDSVRQYKRDHLNVVQKSKTARELEKNELLERVEHLKSSRFKTAQDATLENRMKWREQMTLHYEEEKLLANLKERRRIEAEERIHELRSQRLLQLNSSRKAKTERSATSDFSKVHNLMSKQFNEGHIYKTNMVAETELKIAVAKRKEEEKTRKEKLNVKLMDKLQKNRQIANEVTLNIKANKEKQDAIFASQSQSVKLKSQHDRQLKKLLSIAQNPTMSDSVMLRKSLSLDPSVKPLATSKNFTIKLPGQLSEYTNLVLTPPVRNEIRIKPHPNIDIPDKVESNENELALQILALEKMAERVKRELQSLD